MATSSSRQHQRSLSPSGRFCASSISSSTAFSTRTGAAAANLFHRSSSPTRVNMYSHSPSTSSSYSVRFSVDNRDISPGRSISAVNRNRNPFPTAGKKKTCLCSPTTHPEQEMEKGVNGGIFTKSLGNKFGILTFRWAVGLVTLIF